MAQKNTFLQSLPFVASSDKSGKDFTMPILTAFSQGVTPDNTGGIITLRGARGGKNAQAVLDGVNLYIQENLSYSDLMKMDNGSSMEGNSASYQSGPDWTMFSMRLGLKHHAEIMALYGAGTTATMSTDIGVINSPATATGSPTTYTIASPVTVLITGATWAKLMWLNSGGGGDVDKGMLVDIYQTNGTTLRANNIRVVGVVNSQKCQLMLTATAALGNMPGTTTGIGATVTAGDRIVPAGWVGSSAVGVSGQMTTVGTFAGIDNTSVPQWRPVNFDCGGAAINFDMIQNFASKLNGNGFERGEFDVWAAPPVLGGLINQFTPFTRYNDGAGSDVKRMGAAGVKCDTPIGTLTLRSYGMLKQGEILVIAKGEAVRIGASEGREKGINGTGLALELNEQTGSQMRAMMQFAPLLTTPFWSGRMFGFDVAGPTLAYDRPDITAG
jgi:hypothetical protein